MAEALNKEMSNVVKLWVEKLVPKLQGDLAKHYTPGSVKRFFHPKMHGLLEAEFIVHDDIPDHLKVGVFSEPKTYPAWIRFSNSAHMEKSDLKQNYHGFAIKLMNVPGPKILEGLEDAQTQDFIMVNTPVLNAKSLKNAAQAVLALTGNIFEKLWFAISHLKQVLIATKKSPQINLLYSQYWSQVPYALGDKAVKYSVIPESTDDPQMNDHAVPNYLRYQMIYDLKKGGKTFQFAVQEQTDPDKMPIENPSIEWTSPFQTLATIRIPKQRFDTGTRYIFGNSLAFNPWHSLPEHRPLGQIGEARKTVYSVMSKFRNDNNRHVHREPMSSETPAQYIDQQ